MMREPMTPKQLRETSSTSREVAATHDDTHVVYAFQGITEMWVARCTCGYLSPRRTLLHDAEEFARKHVRESDHR